MTEGGILTVFREVINAFSDMEDIELICLVNNKSLFAPSNHKNINFIEYPEIKKSWFSRLKFEYFTCKEISKKVNPDVWFSLHDITPNVTCKRQYVYCHNPSPFFKGRYIDFKYDKKFWIFTLFYKFLYKINIKKNTAVIVQQSWIAEKFDEWFSPRDLIIAKPVEIENSRELKLDKHVRPSKITLFFPAFPRTFKNFEVLSAALVILNNKGYKKQVAIKMTFDSKSNKYGNAFIKHCRINNIDNIEFLGVLDKNEVIANYSSCDAVVFPSKLETWGLPITEAKSFKKPILLADLPYARETLGNYDNACFFNCDNADELSEIIIQLIEGKPKVFGEVTYSENSPFSICHNWKELAEKVSSRC